MSRPVSIAGQDPGQPLGTARQGNLRDRLVDDRVGDQDLLLRCQEALEELRIAGHQPAHPDARQAVGFRQGGDADRPLRERRHQRQRAVEGHLPVGLVDQQASHGMRFDQLHDPAQGRLGHHRAGRVVRVGQRDQPGPGRHESGQALRIDRPAVLVAQVQVTHLRTDGPGRLEVRGVVGSDDHDLVAGSEQARVDDEQGGHGAGGHQHVIGPETGAPGGDRGAQPRPAHVVAVHQDEVVQLDPEVAQRRVGDRALGQVRPDPVVPELLGRLGLDRHPPVVHGISWCAAAGGQSRTLFRTRFRPPIIRGTVAVGGR